MRYTLVTLSLISTVTFANSAQVQQTLQKEFERNFAIGIVLSDSDVFTLGFHDFDPNKYLNIDNEDIGTQDSIDLRKQVAISTLPYHLSLTDKEQTKARYNLKGRLYALSIDQDVTVNDDKRPDRNKELILGAYNELQRQDTLSEHLTLSTAAGAHFMYYRNDYDYRSDALDNLKPYLEGIYLNTNAWALVGEVNAELKYLENEKWGKWYVWSSPHYFYGAGWGEGNNGDVGNPEGWYWVNGVKLFYDFTKVGRTVQSVYTSFNRVDVGGDTSKPMNTSHYYEASVGWLMTPPFKSDWIDNVGLGLTINYGSALKGGSLVLFFNQE
ncbi:Solitary outer membrane autotransporter beta-barrel domain [Vibrio harveyi]|uniref:Solitary outer membrane autotransporter beta-barrel domain n=1 Tax=Vibrio harveyi TaxID=669 RepID=UPI0018F245E9|nr:Solitary outer membrane autotransporter beta-barrel domain [Vibrio harveyi]